MSEDHKHEHEHAGHDAHAHDDVHAEHDHKHGSADARDRADVHAHKNDGLDHKNDDAHDHDDVHAEHDHKHGSADARDHADVHGHDHAGHDHAGHDHLHADAHRSDDAHGSDDAHSHDDNAHADAHGPDDDHAGHDHAGHDHAGHDHAGFSAHSTALLADAAHNMGDVLGLGMAWGAMALARRERTARHTYGLRRTTILAALGNGGLVLFAIGGVVWAAVQRLSGTVEVDGGLVAAVAALGVVLNALAALLFARGREHDMNIRGAFLHLVADAAVSAGVVIAGLVVWKTGWAWIDPATSLLVSAVILVGTWKLVREATHLLLDAVPGHIDSTEVERFLAAVPSVEGVHDLHIWSMSTTEVALTAHLVVPWDTCSPRLVADVSAKLARKFKIGHITIQLEPVGHGPDCEQGVQGAV